MNCEEDEELATGRSKSKHPRQSKEQAPSMQERERVESKAPPEKEE